MTECIRKMASRIYVRCLSRGSCPLVRTFAYGFRFELRLATTQTPDVFITSFFRCMSSMTMWRPRART